MRPGDRVVPLEHGQGTWRSHGVFNVSRRAVLLGSRGLRGRWALGAECPGRSHHLLFGGSRGKASTLESTARLPKLCSFLRAVPQEKHWYRIPKDLTIATAATMVVK